MEYGFQLFLGFEFLDHLPRQNWRLVCPFPSVFVYKETFFISHLDCLVSLFDLIFSVKVEFLI